MARMPIIKSAKKKLRADARKRIVNQRIKTSVRESLKLYAVKSDETNLGLAFSALDKAVKKGIIPKKRADRKKSRLTKILKKARAASKPTKKPAKKATKK
jgi:small subunit ribosomal protein S20